MVEEISKGDDSVLTFGAPHSGQTKSSTSFKKKKKKISGVMWCYVGAIRWLMQGMLDLKEVLVPPASRKEGITTVLAPEITDCTW